MKKNFKTMILGLILLGGLNLVGCQSTQDVEETEEPKKVKIETPTEKEEKENGKKKEYKSLLEDNCFKQETECSACGAPLIMDNLVGRCEECGKVNYYTIDGELIYEDRDTLIDPSEIESYCVNCEKTFKGGTGFGYKHDQYACSEECFIEYHNFACHRDEHPVKSEETKKKEVKEPVKKEESKQEEMGQCYDCGKYYPVKNMTFNGRSYHCGCVDDKVYCGYCGEEGHTEESCEWKAYDEELDDAWVCPNCGRENIGQVLCECELE